MAVLQSVFALDEAGWADTVAKQADQESLFQVYFRREGGQRIWTM